MDHVRTKATNIGDQALFLLDDFQSHINRKKLDIFAEMDQHVAASFAPTKEEETSSSTTAHPFTVAARLSRSNYEEQAKSEALMQALQKLRSRPPASANIGHHSSGRIIRSR